MRPRISMSVCVRPSVGRSVRRSVRPSVDNAFVKKSISLSLSHSLLVCRLVCSSVSLSVSPRPLDSLGRKEKVDDFSTHHSLPDSCCLCKYLRSREMLSLWWKKMREKIQLPPVSALLFMFSPRFLAWAIFRNSLFWFSLDSTSGSVRRAIFSNCSGSHGLWICVSVCLSVYLSVCLSVCLSFVC